MRWGCICKFRLGVIVIRDARGIDCVICSVIRLRGKSLRSRVSVRMIMIVVFAVRRILLGRFRC